MRRSFVNHIIRQAEAFIAECRFLLPPIASWDAKEWERHPAELKQVQKSGVGWDITDFGTGEFNQIGLVLFTLRNGLPPDVEGDTLPYAEKLLVSRASQVTPMHFHKVKVEDIIVRGGAPVAVKLCSLRDNGDLDRHSDISIRIDGFRQVVSAGSVVRIEPGQSITLEPYVAHSFWGADGTSLIGEVSSVNDDKNDNFFFSETARFPTLEEDELPYRLIVPDYLA